MEKGICCICGFEKDLTYEHIPPQGSGNSSNVKAYKLDYINADSEGKLLENLTKHTFVNLVDGKRYIQHQQGFGVYGTCGYCNNTIKAVYDEDYANLANWVLRLIQEDTRLVSKDSKSVRIKYPFEFIPIHFVKCIIAMFAVLYGRSLFDEHINLRNFVMNRDSVAFDGTKYKLYMYLLKSQIIYKCEPAIVGSVSTPEGMNQLFDIIDGKTKSPVTLEFGAHPFGFVLDINNPISRSDLSDMSCWISPNKYIGIEFRLNAFFKNSPAPCQLE